MEKGKGGGEVCGLFTGTAADYANRSRQGGVDDGPSLTKIGTGEGAQVYGWGLYGSTVRGVAERYAKDAREYNAEKNGKRIDLIFPKNMLEAETAKRLMENDGDVRKTIEKLKRKGIGSAIIKELEEHGSEYSVGPKHEQLYEQTFFTDRAPGDESHLLKWYDAISDANWDRVIAQAEKEGLREKLKGAWWLYFNGDLELFITDNGNSGDAIYERLSKLLGGPQSASEFLARAGIDGVKYPVDSYGGKTVKDGDKAGWNYVSFRDDNIRVDHKWTDGQAKFAVGRPYQKSKQPEDGTFVRYTGKTPEATALTRRSVAAVRSSVASMGSLANAVPKVKGAIEGIDKALESIETGKPVKGFSKAVSPSNLITTLKVAGFKRTAEGAPSAYLMLEDRSIRISNHSGDAFRFKKDNNLSVKLVLGTTHKPFNKDAGFPVC